MDAAAPWAPFLTGEEREVIERGRYARDQPLGGRPCVLLVDLQRSIVGLDAPILEQIDRFPSGVGSDAWRAVRTLGPVVRTARATRSPLIYTRLVQDGEAGMYGDRIQPRALPAGAAEIVDELAPAAGDVVIDKHGASAFDGTPLATVLVRGAVDTVLVAGGSTSGCVRATAVDAASRGYRVALIWDGTFDRIVVSHAASLLDVWMKYGALLSADQACEYLERTAAGSGDRALA
jgi:nicotinamidase-related amidase